MKKKHKSLQYKYGIRDKFGKQESERVISPDPRIHEHSNHPDFKFVIKAISYDESDKSINDCYNPEDGANFEYHALIYTDGSIAVSLYECCYAVWNLYAHRRGDKTYVAGTVRVGSLWSDMAWHLNAQSLENIKKYLEDTD